MRVFFICLIIQIQKYKHRDINSFSSTLFYALSLLIALKNCNTMLILRLVLHKAIRIRLSLSKCRAKSTAKAHQLNKWLVQVTKLRFVCKYLQASPVPCKACQELCRSICMVLRYTQLGLHCVALQPPPWGRLMLRMRENTTSNAQKTAFQLISKKVS